MRTFMRVLNLPGKSVATRGHSQTSIWAPALVEQRILHALVWTSADGALSRGQS